MNNRMKPFKSILFNRNNGSGQLISDGLSTTNYTKFDKKTLDDYDHIFFNANSATMVNGEITIGYVPPMFQAGNLDNFTGTIPYRGYQVLYNVIQGTNPVSGLTSGGIYYIRVSPNDPRKIRIYSSSTSARQLTSGYINCQPSDPLTPTIDSIHSFKILFSFSTQSISGYSSTIFKIKPDCDDLYIPNDKKIIMVLRNFVYTPYHIVNDELNPKLGTLKLKTIVDKSHVYEGNVTTRTNDTILLSYNFNKPFEFYCNDNDMAFPIDRTTFLKGEYEFSLDEQKYYYSPYQKSGANNFQFNNYTVRLDFYLVPLDYKCPKILFCDSDNAIKTISPTTVNISYRDLTDKSKRIYFDAQSSTCVNLPTNLFGVFSHGLRQGDTVIYDFDSSFARNLENQKFQPLATSTGNLVYARTVYYVYVQDTNVFGVSLTSTNPTQADCIDLTALASGTTNSVGMSWHYFLKVTNIQDQEIVTSYKYKFSGLREETDNKSLKKLRLKYFNRLKNINTYNSSSEAGKITITNIYEHDDKIHVEPTNEMSAMVIDNIIMSEDRFTTYVNDNVPLEYDNRSEDVFIQNLSTQQDDITLEVKVSCGEVVNETDAYTLVDGDFSNSHHTMIFLLYD